MSERPLVSFKSPSGRAFDVVVSLDGKDISRMTNGFTLDAEVGGVPKVGIQLALPSLDIETRADVRLYVSAHPGYVVLQEPTENGGVRYRSVREAEEAK